MKTLRGYSLLELLITLAIAAVLTLAGGPSFTNILDQNDADTSAANIYRAWQHARSHAISSSKRLSLCGSNDRVSCHAQWEKTLILFEDIDKDGEPGSQEIIQHYPVNATRGSIQSRISFGRRYTTINQQGRSNLTGSFLYCGQALDPTIERKVTWNLAGRPYYTGSNRDFTSSSSIHCD